jgi:hypothetical protein
MLPLGGAPAGVLPPRTRASALPRFPSSQAMPEHLVTTARARSRVVPSSLVRSPATLLLHRQPHRLTDASPA